MDERDNLVYNSLVGIVWAVAIVLTAASAVCYLNGCRENNGLATRERRI